MFRASWAHHQEYKTLTRQPPVQVVMVAGGSSLHPNMAKWGTTCNHNYLYRWLSCQYFILLMMGAWRPKHVENFCSDKICILLHHVGVLFNLILCLLSNLYLNMFRAALCPSSGETVRVLLHMACCTVTGARRMCAVEYLSGVTRSKQILISQHVSGIIMPIIRRNRSCITAYGVLHCNRCP